MTKTELEALRTKYAELKGDTSFSVASVDINAMLDALPKSPRNKLLRTKYLDQKADHNMPGWIVQQDVEMLAKEIVTVESEQSVTLNGPAEPRAMTVKTEKIESEPEFKKPEPVTGEHITTPEPPENSTIIENEGGKDATTTPPTEPV